jgi:hypothetical protein
LSEQRVEDALLAEAGSETADLIKKFRREKAEQNKASLSALFKVDGESLDRCIGLLTQVGFLEELKASWKVPILYRGGLEVRQGKAFEEGALDDGDDD